MNYDYILKAMGELGIYFGGMPNNGFTETINELTILRKKDFEKTRRTLNLEDAILKNIIITLFNVTDLKSKIILLNELYYRTEI